MESALGAPQSVKSVRVRYGSCKRQMKIYVFDFAAIRFCWLNVDARVSDRSSQKPSFCDHKRVNKESLHKA